jgi:hypothetical protein
MKEQNNEANKGKKKLFKANRFINPAIINFVNFSFRKWWLFLIIGIVGGLAGIFYAASQKMMFESRLTFAIDAGSTEGGASGALNLAAQFGFALGAGQNMFEGDNILEILKSRRIIERVFLSTDTFNSKENTLAEYYMDISGIREGMKLKNQGDLHLLPGAKKGALTYKQDSLLSSLYFLFAEKHIVADRVDKKLSIYELKVKSVDERFSKIFTDRLIQQAGDFYTDITSKKDRETLEILEQRVASLKSNVGQSIDTKIAGEDANVNPAFAAAQAPGLKQQYNIKAYGEAYGEMFKTLEMARYQYLKKIPLVQIIDQADYPMKKIKKGKLVTGLQFAIVLVSFSLFLFFISFLFKDVEQAENAGEATEHNQLD